MLRHCSRFCPFFFVPFDPTTKSGSSSVCIDAACDDHILAIRRVSSTWGEVLSIYRQRWENTHTSGQTQLYVIKMKNQNWRRAVYHSGRGWRGRLLPLEKNCKKKENGNGGQVENLTNIKYCFTAQRVDSVNQEEQIQKTRPGQEIPFGPEHTIFIELLFMYHHMKITSF